MKQYLFLTLLVALGCAAFAQTSEPIEGVVSYKSSQNVYIKFDATGKISVGDTLYLKSNDTLVPVLEVKHTSSISVMGALIGDATLDVSDIVLHIPKSVPVAAAKPDVESPSEDENIPIAEPVTPQPEEPDATLARVSQIRGRLSVSTYQHSYGTSSPNVQRMRYTFSLRANNINNSRISAESYISYRHQFEDWTPDNEGRSKALRIYSLAAKYDFTDRTSATIGRKVNTNIANVGAIDGLQGEHRIGRVTLGGFAG
jgi:hypothetical protein